MILITTKIRIQIKKKSINLGPIKTRAAPKNGAAPFPPLNFNQIGKT